ncbi:MAG: hypothetical protein ACYCV6_01860 [Steroidobacteraceae bacterium]
MSATRATCEEAKAFLPQFAAHAVADLEKTSKTVRDALKWDPARAQALAQQQGILPGVLFAYLRASEFLAQMIREAVHIVLPANGEIYRGNGPGAEPISEAECESFRGLPAPVCCFEYPWSIAKGDHDIAAPKRITLVMDGSQMDEPGPSSAEQCHHALIFSIVYNETVGSWDVLDTFIDVDLPLEIELGPVVPGHGRIWGPRGTLRDTFSGEEIPPGPKMERLGGEYLTDLIAVVQACHSLRAGARLERRTEPSSGRRWKFERRGVGGFVYHELRIPVDAAAPAGDRAAAGSHASPAFHVRRAHLRQLASGKLTFVKQCFVGSRAKGFVGKHYKVATSETLVGHRSQVGPSSGLANS